MCVIGTSSYFEEQSFPRRAHAPHHELMELPNLAWSTLLDALPRKNLKSNHHQKKRLATPCWYIAF